MDSLIPLVAIVTSIGVPALVIVAIVFLNHRKKIARFNLIDNALKTDTTPEVLGQLVQSIQEEERKATPPRQNHLIHGTILIALGASFFLLRLILGPQDAEGLMATGAILSMLALAKFVIAFLIVGRS